LKDSGIVDESVVIEYVRRHGISVRVACLLRDMLARHCCRAIVTEAVVENGKMSSSDEKVVEALDVADLWPLRRINFSTSREVSRVRQL
jgi:hypothetical protein